MLPTTRNVRKSLIVLGILAAFTGLLSTGCTSSDTDVAVVEPVTATDSAAAADAGVEAASSDVAANSETASAQTPAVSAAEAGEDAFAVEDHAGLTAAEAGEDEFYIENNSREAEASDYPLAGVTDEADLTTEDGTVLEEIVPAMAVGMPYEVARILILDDGWQPAEGLQPASRNGLDYAEIEDCSGTGLGFCLMKFYDSERNAFEVVVTTAGEEPTVRNWSLY